jgi:hypothetical protein
MTSRERARFAVAFVDVVKAPHNPLWLLIAARMLDPDVTDALAASYVGEPRRFSVHTRLGCAESSTGIVSGVISSR